MDECEPLSGGVRDKLVQDVTTFLLDNGVVYRQPTLPVELMQVGPSR